MGVNDYLHKQIYRKKLQNKNVLGGIKVWSSSNCTLAVLSTCINYCQIYDVRDNRESLLFNELFINH